MPLLKTSFLKRPLRVFKRLLKSEHGGVAIYSAFIAALAMGSGALAVDFGRLGVLRTQMQDRADAGAYAGATQLDGRDGAQARATSVAVNAATQSSGIPGNGATLGVATVNFYSVLTPDPVAAADDLDSQFIEIIMEPKEVDFLLQPLAAILSPSVGAGSLSLSARAVAEPSPYICNAPPLMLCDPGEADASQSLSLSTNVGRQIVLKETSGGSLAAPGNFGLLALPDGSSGASAIAEALAAVEPDDCYSLDVTTAPGSKTNQVKDGINARFDSTSATQAPNVINYPTDLTVAADDSLIMGDGDWDAADYWTDNHGGGLPAGVTTRYQAYLYEQGLEYATDGNLTLYPLPATLPGGYAAVTPAAADLVEAETPGDDSDGDGITDGDDPDQDGVPTSVAANGAARRVVKVAVVQCLAEGVQGSGTFPTNGDFVEIFLTQEVRDPPDAIIYGEMTRALTPTNDPDFHANVRLVE